MNITKQITVIDKDKVKVEDKLIINTESGSEKVKVTNVTENFIDVACLSDIRTARIGANEMKDLYIEKVESKTSKFATGQLYRVEDTYSCDKFDVLIMAVSNSEISAIRVKSASAISIKESEIDARYKFTKIKTIEEGGRPQKEGETEKLLFGKSKDEWFDILCKEFETEQSSRPFFSSYVPSFYFRNNTK